MMIGENQDGRDDRLQRKKPFYRKWWFYVVILALVSAVFYWRYQMLNRDVQTVVTETKYYAVGEAVESGGILTTVHRVGMKDRIEDYQDSYYDPDYLYLIVDMTMKNQTNTPREMKLFNYQIKDQYYVQDLDMALTAFLNRKNKGFKSRELQPEEELSGQLAYKIPRVKVKDKELTFVIPAKIYEGKSFKTNKEVLLNR